MSIQGILQPVGLINQILNFRLCANGFLVKLFKTNNSLGLRQLSKTVECTTTFNSRDNSCYSIGSSFTKKVVITVNANGFTSVIV